MSSEKTKTKDLSESDVSCLSFEETELTLGLRRDSEKQICGAKRGLSSEAVELSLGSFTSTNPQDQNYEDGHYCNNEISTATKPSAKTQVIGWPPVRSNRKNIGVVKKCKYVKVAVDGAPYLRKVDLEMYSSYDQLLIALENMFTCLTTICNFVNERMLMDPTNGVEYLPTYEDKDGDWMLVGDVPWKMFVESCKRLRLMKSSEAIGLAPRTNELMAK
ncbi:auxin-responsive protein IAA1-like [Nicotiana tabacum]|uniref:Auxin-responsive protein n=2 Tax=Nicotiana TaxID=4085 RepID=A0A1S4AP59_TOBAC|nr:PREDICTED: auxin-responsive protein IAA1-like [Nicotiana sylvestris]XP_016478315.1 PREDICTED: auxin-responsive protein IAA1-like [Nicotiana tabacum]